MEEPASTDQPTSLKFLQLHDAFKRMVAVGVDVVDEQAFFRVMAGVPEHLAWPFWLLYKQVVTNIVDNSMEEFEQVVKENDMQQQLADLEALALQRGRALGDSDGADASEDPSAGPAAAERAARVAAKRAERQQLQAALMRWQAQQQDLQSQVDTRRKQVEAAKSAYARVADQMGEVHSAMQGWRSDGVMRVAADTDAAA